MKYFPGWSSHYPMLITALDLARPGIAKSFSIDLDNTDVLELGMGPFSTPLLHWLCFDDDRKLFSYDNDPKYIEMNRRFRSDWHTVELVEDWNTVAMDRFWSVAFVDHRPAGRRYHDIKRLAKQAFIVVVHDTEPENNRFYAYHRAFVKYKYRYDWTKAKPHTTLLSNFIDFKRILDV